MAKVETKTIVLTFNKLVKNGEKANFDLPAEIKSTLEAVAQEMCDAGVIVEAEETDE
jgi:hypothetical protein